MVRFEETANRCVIEAGPFKLVFHRRRDFWSHEIRVADTLLAASFEMEPERDDRTRVVSPAYQQFSMQQAGGSVRALVVGHWGRHHCSGVFAVEEVDLSVTVGVDIAVRSRAELNGLAATYLVSRTASELQDMDSSSATWSLADIFEAQLRFDVKPPGMIGLGEGGRQSTSLQACGRLEPNSPTQRLFYRWQWNVVDPVPNVSREIR